MNGHVSVNPFPYNRAMDGFQISVPLLDVHLICIHPIGVMTREQAIETADTRAIVWSRIRRRDKASSGVWCCDPSPQTETRLMGKYTVERVRHSSALRCPADTLPKLYGTEGNHDGVSVSRMTSLILLRTCSVRKCEEWLLGVSILNLVR